MYGTSIDPNAVVITGWIEDPAADSAPAIDHLDLFVGSDLDGAPPLAHASLGLARADAPSVSDDSGTPQNPGFSIRMPTATLSPGSTELTLAAHTPDHGTWLSTLQLVLPDLGAIPPAPPAAPVVVVAPPAARPPLEAEIQAPQPGAQVPRTFTLQVLAPLADRMAVFLEPDRDAGGRQLGAVSQTPGSPLKLNVNVPLNGHTLYVHVFSTALGSEAVLQLPVVVRS
jgi:hypothetical protein